jgi:hypothetical protein
LIAAGGPTEINVKIGKILGRVIWGTADLGWRLV